MNEQEKYDWMVYVRCMTYNQAPYIVDAMNGFTMQETNFPFVCAVVDDASTDGEQEVIKSYLDEHFDLKDKKIARHEETEDYVLTFARHKTNLNCYFAVFYLKYNHYKKKTKGPYLAQWREKAKYIALCEGDDYWIDAEKLQKQCEFLNSHEECTLVFHNAYVEDADSSIRNGVHKISNESKYIPLSKIIRDGGLIPTLSILYRRESFSEYKDFPSNCPVGDLRLQTYAAIIGKVYYINEIMGVYRLVSSSFTHLIAKDVNKYVNHHKKFIEWYISVNEYTDYKFEEEVKGAIAFSESRIYIAEKKYHKMWNPKYFGFIMNLSLTSRIGLFFKMMGMSWLYRIGHSIMKFYRDKLK